MREIKLTILIVLFSLFSTSIYMANADTLILDEISVIANRTPTELSKIGSSIEVINQDQINRSPSIFLVDFLAQTSGLSVAQSGAKGGLSSVFIRGSSAMYTKVIIDGIDITNTSGTQALPSLSGIMLEDVERIEILKGSQSALYGSQAIGGVINITTKLMNDNKNSYNKIKLEYGSYDTKSLNYSYFLNRPSSDYAFNYYKNDTGGFSSLDKSLGGTEKDGYDQQNFSVKGRHYLSNNSVLSLNIFSKDETTQFDDSFNKVDREFNTIENSQGASIGFERSINKLTHNIQGSYFLSDKKSTSLSVANSKGTRTSASYTGTLNSNAKRTYVFGMDYVEDKINNSNSLYPSVLINKGNNITGLFGQGILALNNDLNLTLGLRQDSHSDFGGHTSTRITSAYNLNNNAILKASFGTGFRAPSLYELYDKTNGNNILKPESSQNLDLGIIQKFPDQNLTFNGTFFSTEVEDLIFWVQTPGSWTGKYKQTSRKIKREGIELQSKYKVSKDTNVNFSYTHTYSDKNGGKVVRVPRNVFLINTNKKINDKLNIFGSIKHANDLTDGSTDPTSELPSYTLVNAKSIYKISENISLSLKIENLLGQKYQTVKTYGTSGRAYYLQLNGSF